jgi:hypothetical protein
MHGLSAMNYDYATAMNEHMADVIAQITRAVILARSKADPDEYPDIKKALGLLIGSIEMDILWPIYRKFPELDPIDTPPPPDPK